VSPAAFASALSRHPVTSQATGEVVGAVLEAVGERPDLVFVTVTRAHAGALEDVVATIDTLLHPLALIGCAAESVLGVGAEIEELPGISLWAGQVGPLHAAALSATRRIDDTWDVGGWTDPVGFAPSAALVLADPFTFPGAEFCADLAVAHPGLPVVGGYASGASGPGGSRLALGHGVRSEGAVAVLLGPATEVVPVVSQGCRPFGRMRTVTKVERNLVLEIAGRPAMECMVDEIAEHLDRAAIAGIEGNGILLGRCVDDRILEPGPQDLLFRPVLGVERATGALSVEDRVPLASTVQFALRDDSTASADLAAALVGHSADAALLFTCDGRGTRLFDEPGHDAAAVGHALGPIPLGGLFAAGEFGPVGGVNFVHTFAASALLFRERYGPSGGPHPTMHDR
jgi:small ligand-binding sensory domain FIST